MVCESQPGDDEVQDLFIEESDDNCLWQYRVVQFSCTSHDTRLRRRRSSTVYHCSVAFL